MRENTKIIEEFLEGTPAWIKSLDKMGEISGVKMCVMCGIQPEKMAQLVEAVKELQEKAWMYDDLCK